MNETVWQVPLLGSLAVFLVFVILTWIFLRSKPVKPFTIAKCDPPLRDPNNPAFIQRRSQAAAAAVLMHHKSQVSGESNEKS